MKISYTVKLGLIFLLIISLPLFSFSQSCANYSVSRTTGITYNDITASGMPFSSWRNATGMYTNDDNRSYPTNIGFDFWYLGVRYTSFSVSSNGFIDFSSSTADGTGAGAYGYSNPQFSASSNNSLLAVTPFYEDMTTNQANSDPLAADIKYLLSGTAPNRTLTIAWFEMSKYGETTPSNLNFQVVLHETTGVIDFIYGTMTFGSASWSYTCGINNSTMSGTPTAVQLKCQQTANTSTFSNAKKNNLSVAPTTNSKITFTPPTPTAAPTGLSFTAIAKTGMTLNWTDNASNEVGYVIYNSTDGANYNFITQVAANSVSAAITSLYPSTTYYWQVYAVTDGYLSAALTGTQATLPAQRIISIITGNWSNTATWDCTCTPTAGDSVIIADGTVVTLNAAGVCYSLTDGQGVSGQLVIGNSTTVRTLTVSKDVRVLAGASMTIGATAPTTAHLMSMGGNLTNSGTLNLAPTATRIMNVTFNKNGNQTISGAGGTTNFNFITLDMGTSNSNVLDVTSTNFTATNNFLTLNNGVFKLSTAATITPFTTNETIPASAGLWINNAGATVSSTGGTISLFGYIRATAGTLNVGNASNNSVTSNGGTVIIDGGALNIAGRLDRPASTSVLTYFTMSSGQLVLATVGSSTASFAPFHMDQVGSTFNMSGGTIIIRRPGSGNLGFLNTGGTVGAVTGGTVQIGDASTPAGQTIQINSSIDIYNLVISNGSAVTSLLVTSDLNVLNDFTINSGSFDPAGVIFSVSGLSSISGALSASSNTGVKTFTGAVTVNAGGLWTSTSLTSTGNLVFKNGIANNGTSFTAGGATFNTNAQVISGATAMSFANVVTVTGIAVTNNNTGGVTMSNTAAGTLTGTGTWTQGMNSALNYSGQTMTVSNLNASATGNTVDYNRTSGNQTIFNPVSNIYYNLIVSNTTATARTKTLSANADVNGDLTISGGSTIFSVSTFDMTVAGNWTNTSTNADPFTEGTRKVTFDGSVLQNINNTGNANGTVFYDVTLNNSMPAEAVRLNAPMNFNGTLDLLDGHMTTTSANLLTGGTISSVALSASPQDSSFIKGPMAYRIPGAGSSVIDFPIGKNNDYRLVELTINQSSAATYTVEMTNSSAKAVSTSYAATIANVSGMRYFTINQSSSTGFTNAQFHTWFQCTQINDAVQDLPNLKLAHYDGTKWQDIGGTASGGICSGSNYAGDVLSNTFTPFIAGSNLFTLANSTGGTNPLPVELLSFDAQPNGDIVETKWVTATEQNSDYFTVQKSADGISYSDVIMVTAAGNSSVEKNYSAIDDEPFRGVSYYRLKEVDFDGKFSFSEPVAVSFSSGLTNMAVFPNPASGPFNVSLTGFEGQQVLIVVKDIHGQEVFSKVAILSDNAQVIAVDPSGKLSSGVYEVIASSNNEIFHKKIVIK